MNQVIPYIISGKSVSGFYNNKSFSLPSSHFSYPKVVEALKKGQAHLLDNLLNAAKAYREVVNKVIAASSVTSDNNMVSYDGTDLFYGGKKVTNVLRPKFKKAVSDGCAEKSLVNFIAKAYLNPSQIAAHEMFDFLSYKELPIVCDGDVLGYKGVDEDYYSCTANSNPNFKLLQGKIDSRQKIYNGLNETIEIERDLVNSDRRVFCAEGLHVGSFDYAKDFGKRVLVMKLSPADVICVPLDCSCQKMRVAKYSVISEIV